MVMIPNLVSLAKSLYQLRRTLPPDDPNLQGVMAISLEAVQASMEGCPFREERWSAFLRIVRDGA